MNKGLFFGITLGIGALLYLWAKGSSVANMVDKLTITPKLGGKPSLKTSGKTVFSKILNVAASTIGIGDAYLEVPIDVEFSNRSDQQLTISVTSVLAYLNDKLVASNKPDNVSVQIKSYATSTLEGIKMQIDAKTLTSIFGTAIESYTTSGDFSKITDNLVVKIGAILNNAFVFDITLNLGKSGNVDTSGKASINGLGLVANNKRNIKPLSDYIAYIPDRSLLHHHDYIVKANGSVIDTADIMHQAATADKANVSQLAHHLQGASLVDTLQNIFDFVYTHIQYELDSRFTEQVRRPLRTLYDQKGDCDCYATLIGSMLEALKIPYKFRIAAYSAGRYQHVYVVVPTDNGGHYTIDPVLDKCFQEKPTTKHLDI